MYRGYNVVTMQGREEVDAYEQSVDSMRKPILVLMQDKAEGVLITELFNSFPADSREAVREAMWRLFDANTLRLTVERRIRLAPEGTNNSWY